MSMCFLVILVFPCTLREDECGMRLLRVCFDDPCLIVGQSEEASEGMRRELKALFSLSELCYASLNHIHEIAVYILNDGGTRRMNFICDCKNDFRLLC